MASEVVSLEGHLIDSGIMARVMDEIIDSGASYEILELRIGSATTTSPTRASG